MSAGPIWAHPGPIWATGAVAVARLSAWLVRAVRPCWRWFEAAVLVRVGGGRRVASPAVRGGLQVVDMMHRLEVSVGQIWVKTCLRPVAGVGDGDALGIVPFLEASSR